MTRFATSPGSLELAAGGSPQAMSIELSKTMAISATRVPEQRFGPRWRLSWNIFLGISRLCVFVSTLPKLVRQG
jgi:hypothetical protein